MLELNATKHIFIGCLCVLHRVECPQYSELPFVKHPPQLANVALQIESQPPMGALPPQHDGNGVPPVATGVAQERDKVLLIPSAFADQASAPSVSPPAYVDAEDEREPDESKDVVGTVIRSFCLIPGVRIKTSYLSCQELPFFFN